MDSLKERGELIGDPNPTMLLAFIDKEPYRDVTGSNDMEVVDHVRKAEPGRKLYQLVVVNDAFVEISASAQKLARCRGSLLVRELQMLSDVTSEGWRQFSEFDQRTRVRFQVE